jgi:2,3-bisphosphoglycerate-dependent phosphoglycerate mutase
MSKILRNLYIVRHGQSIWNHDSKFTGWTDIPLTIDGRNEAKQIASTLYENNIYPNLYFSSVLERCLDTSNIIKRYMKMEIRDFETKTHTTWRLNEKHYGTLEGIPRELIREQYGSKFTSMMRNNFYMKPPVLKELPLVNDYSVYKNCYFENMRNGESKENVLGRLLPYYENDIMYTLNKESNVPIVITHKHCIRVLLKYLLHISDEDFEDFRLNDKTILKINYDEELNFIDYDEIQY